MNAQADAPLQLERVRHEQALAVWVDECRQKMHKHYPQIDFHASEWKLKTLYETKMLDVSMNPLIEDFKGKDQTFTDAFRCYLSELAVEGSLKAWRYVASAFRLLKHTNAESIFDLSYAEIQKIEAAARRAAGKKPAAAKHTSQSLSKVGRILDRLSKVEVIPRLRYAPSQKIQKKLRSLHEAYHKEAKAKKATILDLQITALCQATNALLNNDPRLSATDRVTIALLNLEMCAPSRVNEILCLSIDDHVSLDDYTSASHGTENDEGGAQKADNLRQVHAQLIVTMKGSKGAQWSAKPVLSFMIGLFNYCLNLVKKHGQHSRMLVTWYEEHPDRLYLPPELEYLRGQDLSTRSLAKILYLDEGKGNGEDTEDTAKEIFSKLKDKRFKVSTGGFRRDHSKLSPINMISWHEAETYLLTRVQKAMNQCRKVTAENFYQGTLSKMLFLFDGPGSRHGRGLPCLPAKISYFTLVTRLKQSTTHKNLLKERGVEPEPTLFEKLNITMPVNGVEQIAWIGTHDPRRFLTTAALSAREKVSDVLINKWASRLSIQELGSYDLRTDEAKAAQSAMPDIPDLKDLSAGMSALEQAEESVGLKTEIITVHEAGISVTSMDSIAAAIDDRPVARTSGQLFIIYPTKYGACVHQHHEKPCAAYVCLPCNDNLVVKGHLPTNDAVRKRNELLQRSILTQVEKLIIAQNRGVADHPDSLDAHLITLIGGGLDPEAMTQQLIDHFHEIKDSIKDVSLKNKLEEAFVAKTYVRNFDAPAVFSGALMKYNNPTRHALPGLERALDAHGGRDRIETDQQEIIKLYPQFAPTSLPAAHHAALMAPPEESADSDETDDGEDSDA